MTEIINYEELPDVEKQATMAKIQNYGTASKWSYTVQDNLVRMGGIVTINTDQYNTATNVSEGVSNVSFGTEFKEILDFNCVALDNNTGAFGEHSHMGQVTNTSMNVYATVHGNNNKVIQVKWSIEGVL